MEGNCKLMAHKAWMLVLFGVLVLINATWPIVSWPLFIGFLAIIFGILALILHGCCCKNCACEAKPIAKRR